MTGARISNRLDVHRKKKRQIASLTSYVQEKNFLPIYGKPPIPKQKIVQEDPEIANLTVFKGRRKRRHSKVIDLNNT